MEPPDTTKHDDIQEKDVTCELADKAAVKTESTANDNAVITDTNKKTTEEKKKWEWPSLGSILQVFFYILMIGQNVPGPHTKFWPFDNSIKEPEKGPMKSPQYAELRSDMYGHERQFPAQADGISNPILNLIFGQKDPPSMIPKNTGIPKQQNIGLTLLNREYEAYRYSMQAATKSKVVAATEFAQLSFQRALGKALFRLTNRDDWLRLTIIEDRFLEEAGNLVDKIADLRASLVDANSTILGGQCNSSITTSAFPFVEASIDEELQCDINSTENNLYANASNVTLVSLGKNATTNSTNNAANLTMTTIKETTLLLNERIITFCREITESLPAGPANHILDVLNGYISTFGTLLVDDLRNSPMRLHFSSRKKRLFVTYFLGDLFATTVSDLRKEVTAIVRSAEANDEVLVVLQSGGGTVTGYGLVAAQLLRIKDAGLKLTIAVEQVAASGGYMAACIGDTIVCSPFAVVGSIGVIQEMPNVHERLKREGVEFHEVTAGDWKRVLTPTKEVTERDLKKAKEDIEDIWTLFKDFVAEQRPSLDLNIVATGEVWFGKRAVEVGLCDTIQASDDVLTDFMDRGYDVYQIKYEEPIEDPFEKFWNGGKESSSGIFNFVVQTFLQKIASMTHMDAGDYKKYKAKFDRSNEFLLV